MEDFLMPDICHSLVEQSVIKDNVFANRLSGMFSPWEVYVTNSFWDASWAANVLISSQCSWGQY